MNPPQLASSVILGVGSLWLFTPHRADKDSGGGGSAGPVPAPEAPIVAKVRSAMGSPSVQDHGEDSPWANVRVSYQLRSGATIVTDFGEELTVDLPSGGQLTLGPGSLLETSISPDGTPLFRLHRGGLHGFVEGGAVAFETAFGGGVVLSPNPGSRSRVNLGDRPSPVIGLSPAPWVSGDWGVSDPNIFVPMVFRGAYGNPQTTVIPEPGTVALFSIGTLILASRLRRRRG